MAGLKPGVNHFAFLDRSDPGDKRLSDFDAAKNTATPAASLTQELFGNAYPSARDYIIRKNQLEKQERAKERAAAARANSAAGASTESNTNKTDGAKRGGYSNNGPSRQQQSGTSGGYKSYNNNGASRRQQPGAAVNKVAPPKGVEAPPAPVQAPPPPPPSLYDINEFPSLK